MLGAARRATEGIQLIRGGNWTGLGVQDLLGARVVGKTLLIVGAGRIGLAVARRSVGWQMRVRYVARSRHEEFEAAPISAQPVELEPGLREADFVSVHTPLTGETQHLIGARERGARLVFCPSPLVGTPLTTSAKFAVVARSPLTGCLSDAISSSHFAIAAKRAGFDAYVLVGRASQLTRLIVDDGAVRLEPAEEIGRASCRERV